MWGSRHRDSNDNSTTQIAPIWVITHFLSTCYLYHRITHWCELEGTLKVIQSLPQTPSIIPGCSKSRLLPAHTQHSNFRSSSYTPFKAINVTEVSPNLSFIFDLSSHQQFQHTHRSITPLSTGQLLTGKEVASIHFHRTLSLFSSNDSLMQTPSTRSQPSVAFGAPTFQETQEHSRENTFQNWILFIPTITPPQIHLPHHMKSYSHSNYHCDYSQHITPLKLNQIRKCLCKSFQCK